MKYVLFPCFLEFELANNLLGLVIHSAGISLVRSFNKYCFSSFRFLFSLYSLLIDCELSSLKQSSVPGTSLAFSSYTYILINFSLTLGTNK